MGNKMKTIFYREIGEIVKYYILKGKGNGNIKN